MGIPKVLLLKTYYELDEVDPLLSLLESFKVYLRRNKYISDIQRETYKNFIKIVNKLARLTPGKSSQLDKLKLEVESIHQIADIGWLREKLEELQ